MSPLNELALWVAYTINREPNGMGLTFNQAKEIGNVVARELAIRYSRLFERDVQGDELGRAVGRAWYEDWSGEPFDDLDPEAKRLWEERGIRVEQVSGRGDGHAKGADETPAHDRHFSPRPEVAEPPAYGSDSERELAKRFHWRTWPDEEHTRRVLNGECDDNCDRHWPRCEEHPGGCGRTSWSSEWMGG